MFSQSEVSPDVSRSPRSSDKVVEKLTAAILDLVDLYCNTFNANFHPAAPRHSSAAPPQEAGLVNNVLAFNVHAAHRIPITWAARWDTHTQGGGGGGGILPPPPPPRCHARG